MFKRFSVDSRQWKIAGGFTVGAFESDRLFKEATRLTRKHRSYRTYGTHLLTKAMPDDSPNFLPAGGNYQELLSYKKSEVVYDFTFRFCEKFLKRGDRTIDQMVQASRSGKQNIAEGSKASITSTEMELKLTNVARASLEELLIDYQDYLRVRDHPLWDKNSKEALYVRKLGKTENESYETYRTYMETRPPEVLSNIAFA